MTDEQAQAIIERLDRIIELLEHQAGIRALRDTLGPSDMLQFNEQGNIAPVVNPYVRKWNVLDDQS